MVDLEGRRRTEITPDGSRLRAFETELTDRERHALEIPPAALEQA